MQAFEKKKKRHYYKRILPEQSQDTIHISLYKNIIPIQIKASNEAEYKVDKCSSCLFF